MKSFCFCIFLMVSCNGLKEQKGFYTAAVFEIAQYQDFSSPLSEIIEKNLDKYNIAAEVASTHNVDILVYPEKGLFPHFNGTNEWALAFAENIPDPTVELTNPCDQYDNFLNSPVLRNLSCLSRKHGIYIVADLLDVKECEVKTTCNEYNADYCRENKEDCPKDGKFYFNTLVAFNRNGTLIARYYKVHLAHEPGTSSPKVPKNIYFETEFGNFSGVVCFDLFFYGTVKAANQPGVTALSFSSWWFDSIPLIYFSTPFQQSWSISNRMNLLAANVQHPIEGSGGSGIYSPAKGPLVYTHNPDGRSKLLISNVPISARQLPEDIPLDTKFYYIDDGNVTELQGEEPRDFKSECSVKVLGNASSSMDYRCVENPIHQYTFIKLNETKGNFNVCSNEFCCRLSYEAQSMNETFYFGVSGNRQEYFGLYLLGNQACFMARCDSLNGKPCRNFRLKSNTIFEKVEISASFDTKYVYPYAINSDIRLTNKDEWYFSRKNHIKYQNIQGQPLLLFGLNGRLYNKDIKLTR